MGILKNRPFAFIDIAALLVLEMLAGLEVTGMTKILTIFENMDNGGRTPTVNVLEGLVFVHAFIMLC